MNGENARRKRNKKTLMHAILAYMMPKSIFEKCGHALLSLLSEQIRLKVFHALGVIRKNST